MKLRARWEGHLPDVGDVLKSGPKARCAYVIVGVTVGRVDMDRNLVITRRAVFEVERIGLDQLPTGAAVHTWTWDRRDRRPA